VRARSSVPAWFFAASEISKRCFGLDLAPIVPGLSLAASKAYEFLHSQRAHPRLRAGDHQFRASNPAERNFDDPIFERSTYAVPQSVGMFAIKGSRTTLVKDDSALGAAMIGADVIPIFI